MRMAARLKRILPARLAPLVPALALAALHLLAAEVYWQDYGWGLGNWDDGWHALPMDALRHNLVESIWYLHAQPPGFNLYGALFGRAFFPDHMQAMHYANVVLGLAMVGLAYRVAVDYFPVRALAWAATAVLVALNPTLLLYEFAVFYTLPVAFLLTLAAACLAFHRRASRDGYLVAFLATWALVVLTRTLYHLVVLVPVVGLACLLAGPRWRRMLAIGLTLAALPFGWYAKNYVQFGFFGATSWTGANLWRVVDWGYSRADLERLAAAGTIDPMVAEQRRPFRAPSNFTMYGFDKTSDIEVLARDDFNNINMIDIANTYGHSALRAIWAEPRHYVHNVSLAFRIFTWPSFYPDEIAAPRNLYRHMRLYREMTHGPRAMTAINRLLGTDYVSVLVFILPGALLAYGAYLLGRCRLSARRWVAAIRRDPVTVFSFGLIVYTIAVGCTFEFGENDRFKVAIEPVMWLFLAGLGYRAWCAGWTGLARWHRSRLAPVVTDSGDSYDPKNDY